MQRTYIKQKAKKYAHELMHFIRVQWFSWFNKIIFRSKHVVLLSNAFYHRELILSMSCNKKAFDNYCYERLSAFISIILPFLGASFVYTDLIGEVCVCLKLRKIRFAHKACILKFLEIYAIITKN